MFKNSCLIYEDVENLHSLLESMNENSEDFSDNVTSKWSTLESEVLYFQEELQSSFVAENELQQQYEVFVEDFRTLEDLLVSVDEGESEECFKTCFEMIQVRTCCLRCNF